MKTNKNEKKHKHSKISEIEEKYKKSQEEWKAKIKAEPKKSKRFWKWVWYFFAFPWVWIWTNIRDWRTIVIFVIVFLLVSIEVWGAYLVGLIFWNNEAVRIAAFSVGSAGLVFWNVVPCTPFLLICIFLTITIKGILNKIEDSRKKHLVECSKCGAKRIEKRCTRVYDAEQDKFVYVCPKCTRAVTKGK